MFPRVLVLGGTGFVGRHLCAALAARQWPVTVVTRRLAHARSVQFLPLLDVQVADVFDEASLTRLVARHDAVVNLIAILQGREADFERVHVELPQRIVRACAATGVRRVIQVSALGADPAGPSRYLRSKGRGELALRDGDLALSVLRPSVIFGDGDRFLNLFARLQSVFPVMPLAGAGTRFQPVWVEDVADAVIACLRDTDLPRSSVGQTFECAGPDVLTLGELVRLAGRLGSRERPVVPLPTALGRLQALAMECLPGEPLMSRDNLDSMAVDNIATSQWPGLSSLGIVPRSVHSVAPLYLGRQAVRQRLDRLRSGGR